MPASGSKKIGRVFIEVSADISALTKSINDAIMTMNDAGGKMEAYGRRLASRFENALNPTEKLGQKIAGLGKIGYDAADIARVLGDQLEKAMQVCQRNGQTPNALTASTYELYKKLTGTESALGQLGQTLTDFARNPLEAAKSGIGNLLALMGPTAVGIGGIATAVVTAAYGLAKFAESMGDQAVELRNEAMAAGMSIQQYQALKRVGVETGIGLESLPRMLGMLNRELATGAKMDFVKVLNALREAAGEGAADLSHGVLPIIDDLGKRIAAAKTEAERGELINAAYNRRLQELGTLSVVTRGHLQDLTDAVIKQGAAWGPETQERLERVQKNFAALGRWWQSVKFDMLDFFSSLAVEWKGAAAYMSIPIPGVAPGVKTPPKPVNTALPAPEASAPSLEALERQKKALQLARLIHDGTEGNREALIRLAEADEKYNKAVNEGSTKNAMKWAAEYAAIKTLLDAEKELPKVVEKYLEAMDAIRKIQDEMNVKGHAALVPTGAEVEKASKATHDAAVRGLEQYYSIQKAMARDTTQGYLNQLRLEQQITALIVPRNEYEREQIELEQTRLEFAIREEEIRVKYAQKHYELEERIRQLAAIPFVGPGLAAMVERQLPQLEAQMQDEIDQLLRVRAAAITRIHAEEYKRMIDVYKQYAGSLFDAIFQSGQKGFKAILDWLKNIFASLLREIVSNALAGAIQNSGIYQAIRKMMAGTYPTPTGTSDFFARMSQTVEQGTASAIEQATAPTYAWKAASQEWQPENYVMAPAYGTQYAGYGAGTLAIPGLYQLGGAGAGTGGGGGAGAAAAGGGLLGGLSVGSLLTAGVPSAGLMGLMSHNAYLKTAGGVGLGLTGLAATASIMTGMPLATAMGLIFTNPWSAVIGGAALGVTALVKKIKGPSTQEAGSAEMFRDFAISIDKNTIKDFIGQYLDPEKAWGIRKDILSSPQYLTQIAGPAAERAGKMNQFLKSLETVQTSWGTFNFREAYEIGNLTGDWSKLDEAFINAFKSSKELQKVLPNWKDVLTVTGDAAKKAAKDFEDLYSSWQSSGEMTQEFVDYLDRMSASLDAAAQESSIFAQQLEKARASAARFAELKPLIEGFKSLKEDLPGAIAETKTIYQTFLETGEILPELRKQILEYGGDIQAFTRLADIAKVNNQFQLLVEHFKQTGEVLPELRKMVADFGADLSVLDRAAALPDLMKGLQGIKDLASGIAGLQKTPIEQVLAGEWGPETWSGLAGMGLEPGKLTGITDLLKFEKGWDQAVSDLATKTKYVWDEKWKKYTQVPVGLEQGGLIEQALWRFGGTPGATAIQNYRAGFNTITPELLAATKSQMDIAYQNEIKNTLSYLGQAEEDVSNRVVEMTADVTGTLDAVSVNIGAAISDAKQAVIIELDKILDAINKSVNAAAGVSSAVTPTGISYYSAAGKPYAGETESYWQTEGQWYRGTQAGVISPTAKTPWQVTFSEWLKTPEVQDFVAGNEPDPAIWEGKTETQVLRQVWDWYQNRESPPVGWPAGAITQVLTQWYQEGVPLTGTSAVPAAETGALVRVHDQEAILNREQTANLLKGEAERSIAIYIDQRGSTISSNVDMERSVEKALLALRARGFKIAFAH